MPMMVVMISIIVGSIYILNSHNRCYLCIPHFKGTSTMSSVYKDAANPLKKNKLHVKSA